MRILTLLLGLLVGGWLVAGPAQAQDDKTLSFSESLDDDGTLIVETHKGSVVVTVWDRDEVEAEVRIVADGNDALVEGTDVIVRHTGRTVRFETEYDVDAWDDLRKRGIFGVFSDGFSSPFVHYEIRMPRTARLRIDDHKSEIRVTGLQADLTIETHKGIVDVKDLDGALRLETHKGIVDVHFSRLADDSVVDTYKGTVTLFLPEDEGFDLYADLSRKGDLDSDFRVEDDRRGRRDRDGDGYWDADDDDDDGDQIYRAEVNGGGPRLRLDTYKGRFNLRAN